MTSAKTNVGAARIAFHDFVAGIVDNVVIVAGAADHGVGAVAAVERIEAFVADEHVRTAEAGEAVIPRVALDPVGERIARADRGGAEQDQVLDIGVQRENVDRGGDRVLAVAARADRLVDDIRNDIHKVSIIAGRADHRIGFAADACGQGIVPAEPEELVALRVADDEVNAGVARGGDCHASQRQRLDVRAQRIVDLGKDDVRPLTRASRRY